MTVTAKRRILIIDDQESIHQDYRKIIAPPCHSDFGLAEAEAELFGNVAQDLDGSDRDLYEIDSAFQGLEAIGLVQKALQEGRPYAVAFVDIRMPPGCDGIQTVRKIWEFDPELLVVICSAYSDYSWEDIARELGRTDRFLILRKPFENIEVRQCAAALTERWVIARTDALTGLLNRRAFQEQLSREWTFAVRHQRPLCCVMLDIDFFKSINDRFGHSAGDHVLQTVAETIQLERRPGDAVCRYGGEEICILMPNTSEEEGYRWADGLRHKIAQQSILAGGDTVRLTASFGVAASDPAMTDELQLVELADTALRHAKQAGRNRVVRGSGPASSHRDPAAVREYAALFDGVQAREIMTSHVVSVRSDMTVGQAAEMLLQCGVSSAPVVDSEGTLSGVISEKDLMEALGSEYGWSTPLSQVLTAHVVQYEPTASAQVIFDFLCRVQLRRVIIAEEGKPVGVVSRSSFLRWIRNYVQSTASSSTSGSARLHLFKTAESLVNRSMQLRDDLQADADNLVYPAVCGVSAIEMLLGDLLMWAGCSKSKKEGENLAECL